MRPFFLALCAAAFFAAPAGFAQSPPAQAAPADDPARAQFELGVAAMQREAWPEALAAFEASMRLRRSAAVALDLGVVLYRLDRLSEARVWLQAFNELASPAQHRLHDETVARTLADVARRLARLRITSLSPGSAAVLVDGRRAQLNEAGEVALDPGSHTVRGEAPGHLPWSTQVELSAGGTAELRVELEREPPPAPPPVVIVTPHPAAGNPPMDPRVTPTSSNEASPIYTRWWFWTALGAVAAGGAAAAVVLATSGTRPLPETSSQVTLTAATRQVTQ